MVNKKKYIKFIRDILEECFIELRLIKENFKDYKRRKLPLDFDDVAKKSAIIKKIIPDDYNYINCEKILHNILITEKKKIKILENENNDELFVNNLLKYFNKSYLKKLFIDRDEYCVFIQELLDVKYDHLKKYYTGNNAEQNEDMQSLMEIILDNPDEIEFIDKSCLESSSNLRTFASKVLNKEEEKANLLNDDHRLKEIKEQRNSLTSLNASYKQDFKGDDKHLRAKVYKAINEDLLYSEIENC